MLAARLKTLSGRLGAIHHVRTHTPVAALTFDDGPNPDCTPRLLDLLDRHCARATFFMVGQAASRYPALVQLCAARGHTIANHSWDHCALTSVSRRERRRQLAACAVALRPFEAPYVRPPYGQQNFRSYADAVLWGYRTVGWSVDVGDWWKADSRAMADELTQQIRPGTIALLHDAIYDQGVSPLGPEPIQPPLVDRGPMLEALGLFLERTKGSMKFVTVPELVGFGAASRQGWGRITT